MPLLRNQMVIAGLRPSGFEVLLDFGENFGKEAREHPVGTVGTMLGDLWEDSRKVKPIMGRPGCE